MRETCSSGSVRGAFSNERPYRERVSHVAGRSAEGPMTEPTVGAQPGRWELVFMSPRRPAVATGNGEVG